MKHLGYDTLLLVLFLSSCTSPLPTAPVELIEEPIIETEKSSPLVSSNPYVEKLIEENGIATLIPDKELFNLGDLVEGTDTKHELYFTNTSEHPLIIFTIYASCPCAYAYSYPDTTLPGARGKIIVRFNTKGKKGAQSKTLNIKANTSTRHTIIRMGANILEEEAVEEERQKKN
ncbi:MAG: DUF1573 domain-containing protein [Aureispira sp.]